MRKKGFTLIELLVVVSIISLLVSILLPALGRAKEAAQATKCMAQLKGIGCAVQMYLADNEDRFFLAGTGQIGVTWYNTDLGERYFAGEYLDMGQTDKGNSCKDEGNILDCPTNKEGYAREYGYFVDYAYNIELGPNGTRGVSAGSVKTPGGVVCFAEVAGNNFWLSSGTMGNDWELYAAYPHANGFGNFLFVDGHVDRHQSGELTDDNFIP